MHKKLLCSNEWELWGLIPVSEVLRCLPSTLTICGLKDEGGRHPKEHLREPSKLKYDLFKGFVISSALCPCSLFSVEGHVWEQKVTLPNIWLCLTEHTIAFPIFVLCVCPRCFNPLAEAKYYDFTVIRPSWGLFLSHVLHTQKPQSEVDYCCLFIGEVITRLTGRHGALIWG